VQDGTLVEVLAAGFGGLGCFRRFVAVSFGTFSCCGRELMGQAGAATAADEQRA
jgi:hypothetical protein